MLLEKLQAELTGWRMLQPKSLEVEVIPNRIWKKVFSLTDEYSELTICKRLGIRKAEFDKQKPRFSENPGFISITSPKSENINLSPLCELKLTAKNKVLSLQISVDQLSSILPTFERLM